jgi:hypothetical protein
VCVSITWSRLRAIIVSNAFPTDLLSMHMYKGFRWTSSYSSALDPSSTDTFDMFGQNPSKRRFCVLRAVGRKVNRACRRMKRSRHLPFVRHRRAAEYDLHHSSTPYQTIYKPAFSRTGSDHSQIASYIEEKFSDVLHRAEEVSTLYSQGSPSRANTVIFVAEIWVDRSCAFCLICSCDFV